MYRTARSAYSGKRGSLLTFHIHLNEFLFDFGHFVIEIVCCRERRFQSLIITETFVQVLNLRSRSRISLTARCSCEM